MKKDSMEKSSVLRMINGAIEERVDYEVGRLIENVMDRNTKPNQKRKITITLEFVPDETRTILHLNAVVKATLAPTDSVKTTLSIITDGNTGEVVVHEVGAQIPGQYDMAGEQEPQPKILQFVSN